MVGIGAGMGWPRPLLLGLCALPVVEGDFFPMDTECCGPIDLPKKVWNCWTGYWSSFPALKW